MKKKKKECADCSIAAACVGLDTWSRTMLLRDVWLCQCGRVWHQRRTYADMAAGRGRCIGEPNSASARLRALPSCAAGINVTLPFCWACASSVAKLRGII